MAVWCPNIYKVFGNGWMKLLFFGKYLEIHLVGEFRFLKIWWYLAVNLMNLFFGHKYYPSSTLMWVSIWFLDFRFEKLTLWMLGCDKFNLLVVYFFGYKLTDFITWCANIFHLFVNNFKMPLLPCFITWLYSLALTENTTQVSKDQLDTHVISKVVFVKSKHRTWLVFYFILL